MSWERNPHPASEVTFCWPHFHSSRSWDSPGRSWHHFTQSPWPLFMFLLNKPFLNYFSIKNYSSLNITFIMWLLPRSIPLSLEWTQHPLPSGPDLSIQSQLFTHMIFPLETGLAVHNVISVLRGFMFCTIIHTSLCLEVSSSVSLPRKYSKNTRSFI